MYQTNLAAAFYKFQYPENALKIDGKVYEAMLHEKQQQAHLSNKALVFSSLDGVVLDFTYLEYIPSYVFVGLIGTYAGWPTAIVARPAMVDDAWHLIEKVKFLIPRMNISFHKTFSEALKSIDESIEESEREKNRRHSGSPNSLKADFLDFRYELIDNKYVKPFLLMQFAGEYPYGTAGARHAEYMQTKRDEALQAAYKTGRWPQGIIWNFSNLNYVWGDGMAGVLRPFSVSIEVIVAKDET